MRMKPISPSPMMQSEIQHSQDSEALFTSSGLYQIEEVNMSIAILDNMRIRKSESIWHSRHSAGFHLL